jgi:hypothetical protein
MKNPLTNSEVSPEDALFNVSLININALDLEVRQVALGLRPAGDKVLGYTRNKEMPLFKKDRRDVIRLIQQHGLAHKEFENVHQQTLVLFYRPESYKIGDFGTKEEVAAVFPELVDRIDFSKAVGPLARVPGASSVARRRARSRVWVPDEHLVLQFECLL